MSRRRYDDIPVFDRGRDPRAARALTRALEYVASFEPAAYHDTDDGDEFDGFHEWEGDE